MNAINVIAPYHYLGMWVFDDPRAGLVEEPFVSGADTLIDRAVVHIPDARSGFLLLFSSAPFPGHEIRLEWRHGEADGNWYYSRDFDLDLEGWLSARAGLNTLLRSPTLRETDSMLSNRGLLSRVPILLTSLRALLAPVVVSLALLTPLPSAFAICLLSAFLSDILDGIVARRLGVATPSLRRLDSLADSLFYAAATFAVWHLYPAAITSRWLSLTLLAVMELSRYGFDFVKFRREASYHMWSSKAWGIALFVAFFSLLALGSDNMFIDLAIYVGIGSDLEGLAISAVLPKWQTDMPSLIHALRLRTSERV